MKAVAQDEAMGCGVACVASICGLSYKKTKSSLFYDIGDDRAGYLCKDLVKALRRSGRNYAFAHIKKYEKKGSAYENGAIVYIKEIDHYLLKTKRGWMDPWVNFPEIGTKIKSGFRKKCPAKPQWIIYPLF